MALFQFKWLRRFVRRHTSPIPLNTAEVWKRRFSIVYALLAWQALGLVAYMVYTGRSDWAKYYGYAKEEDRLLSPAQHYAKVLNIDKAKLVRFSGLHKVDESVIDKKEESEAES